LIQSGVLAFRQRYVDEKLRWFVNATHVLGDEGDDRIRKALVFPVVLYDEHWADFRTTPIGVRVIQEDDITALHGFGS
jgi:hypothetical protein